MARTYYECQFIPSKESVTFFRPTQYIGRADTYKSARELAHYFLKSRDHHGYVLIVIADVRDDYSGGLVDKQYEKISYDGVKFTHKALSGKTNKSYTKIR